MELQLVALPRTVTLTSVERERHSRDNVFAAMDLCRKQYLILSQRLSSTLETIQDVVGEDPPLSSLYECSKRLTRRGRIGSFSIVKLTLAQAPEWLAANRHRYDTVLITTTQPCKWITLSTAKTESDTEPPTSDQDDVWVTLTHE